MQLFVRAIVTLLLFVMGASNAHAGDPFAKPAAAQAREHLSRGNKFYSVREFDKAITEYKAGALVEQAAIFDYNLGQCYRQLGDYDAATWHYQQFLRRAQPEGEVLKAVQDFLAQMEAEKQKKAMSQPPTEAAPASATVPAADTPPARTDVTPSASEPAPQRTRSRRLLAWSLTGAGVVGTAVGAGFLWNASTLRDEANSAADQQTRNALHDKADSRRLTGTIIGIGGGALLVTGVIVFAISKDDGNHPATAWRLGVSPSGVFASGRF